jgi:putative oxidoreductase
MRRFLGNFSTLAFTAMRVVLAFMYVSHGLRWLFGVFGGRAVPLFSMLGAAGLIEIVCGTLIGAGLFTWWAAFIASGEMAFAYFIVHNPRSHFPIQNGGEITVALCFVFLYIATHGAGPISLDRLRGAGGRASG